ncbi:hypothetical protein CFAM422_009999 [Trichoderma lentiforme]|uniref:Uncharacterized protein n=1 Tax=Trichoderma lentiforme TaxID=1567552 RepID=A0A9P5C8E3_9HYPO|nr:hypothetical protein CFAM422_009999 [Trichoderma lentiforme]
MRGNAHRGHLLVQVALQRPNPPCLSAAKGLRDPLADRPVVLASGIDDSESQLRRDSVGTSGTISLCILVPCAQPRIANGKSKNRGRPSLTPQIPGLSRAIVLPPLSASEQTIHASQARTQPQLFLSSLPPDSAQGLPLLNLEVYSDRSRSSS